MSSKKTAKKAAGRVRVVKPVAVTSMSDEALDDAWRRTHRRLRKAKIVIGRHRSGGAVVAVSEDLPDDILIVTKGEILDEIEARKSAAK